MTKKFNTHADYNICGIKGQLSHMTHKGLFGRNSSTTLCGMSTKGFDKEPYLWIVNCGCSKCKSVVASETPNFADLEKLTEEEIWELDNR